MAWLLHGDQIEGKHFQFPMPVLNAAYLSLLFFRGLEINGFRHL